MSGANGHPRPETTAADPAAIRAHLRTLYGTRRGYVPVFSGVRRGEDLRETEEKFYAWPATEAAIVGYIAEQARTGREVYTCAHLTTRRERKKPAAAPTDLLWSDLDHDRLPAGFPAPTYVVESSPGRWQPYWRLTEDVAPERAEALCHRVAAATGADSGWHLGKILRVPGTANNKYADRPPVRVLHSDGRSYDPDALDRILPPAPAASPRSTTSTASPIPDTDEGDDEPPVELDALGLAVWRGERRKLKDDVTGEIDRSETLWWLACELREAGATRRTVAAGVAERDAAWGWGCYDGRPGEYDRIATKVVTKIPRSRAAAGSGDMPPADAPVDDGDEAETADGDPCADVRDALATLRAENARLQRENADLLAGGAVPASCPANLAQARRRIAQLEEVVATQQTRVDLANQQAAIFRNPKLGAARSVGAALTQLFRQQEPAKPEDPAGWRTPLGRLGDLSGLSNDACSRQVKQLGSYRLDDGTPLLHVKVIDVRGGVNTETGEIVSPHKELWVGPGTKPEDFGRVLASLAPAERKAWGGRADRNVCSDHPDAGVVKRTRLIKRTEYECATCRRTLDTIDETVREKPIEFVDAAPTPHDAASPPAGDEEAEQTCDPPPSPTPQHAASNGHLAIRGNGYPPRILRHRKSPADDDPFAGDEPPPHDPAAPIASAWMAGRPFPGMEPPPPKPPDPYTDVAHGARGARR